MKTLNYFSSAKLLAKLSLVGLVAWQLGACQQQTDEAKPAEATASTDLNSEQAVDKAAAQIDEQGLMKHINTLASDEFEGRAPSTPGGKKTVAYLEQQMKQIGLEPAFKDANGEGSYRQAVELFEQEVTNSPTLELSHADGSVDALKYKEDSIAWSTRVGESAALDDSQLVFVGYGVVAPEYNWNDYDGIDMTGKTAVILVNDPGFRSPEGDAFKGNTMTYYGRWTYKYEEAARQGATGAIVVHEEAAAGYPWGVVSGSWSGAQYMLFSENGNKDDVAVSAWMTQNAAQTMFAKAGLDYQEMVGLAGQAEFKPVALPVKASLTLSNTSRRSTSYNVAGVIKGRSNPDELFIYTAHWDHIGIKPVEGADDVIFNGAQDNATGTAGLLEMAEAFKALPQAPKRSVMFLAVTAEESGLLGSAWYAANPAYPMNKTVAGINVDGMSTIGATDDIVVVGYGNSQMDDFLRIEADKQGRVLVQEPTPEKGYFYRSDHFNLAKKGVPMLYAEAGIQIRGKEAGYGEAESKRYLAERYHKPADEVHPEWDNGGILQDLNAHFRIGVSISDSNVWPQWSDGNEFKAIRETSLSGNN